MINVGLTGSIAVGKTFVCNVLRELGCYVLDADATAREVVGKGSPVLAELVERFGGSILLADGSLDRKRLGSMVFGDKEKLAALNSIVHPPVIARQTEWLREIEAKDADAIAVIDAALMIESGNYKRFDKLIVVWCEPDIQFARLKKRDELSDEEARRRIASQMPQDEKKKFADILIDTSGTPEDTRRRTTEVFHELRRLNTNEKDTRKPKDR
jgi:dephospho-CoA kinase